MLLPFARQDFFGQGVYRLANVQLTCGCRVEVQTFMYAALFRPIAEPRARPFFCCPSFVCLGTRISSGTITCARESMLTALWVVATWSQVSVRRRRSLLTLRERQCNGGCANW